MKENKGKNALSEKIIFLCLGALCFGLIWGIKGFAHDRYFSRQDSIIVPASLASEGKASWYGRRFQGRKTACGERYDMFELTAAHRKLPLGSIVKVTNLSNNRHVIVRVNDRGPYIGGRIIDLSVAAAAELRMVKKGVTKVRVEVLSLGS